MVEDIHRKIDCDYLAATQKYGSLMERLAEIMDGLPSAETPRVIPFSDLSASVLNNISTPDIDSSDDFQTLARERVADVLNSITDQEKQAFALRMGLSDGRYRTFRGIANEVGCSVSTAWERNKRALEKLRHPYPRRSLPDYLSE